MAIPQLNSCCCGCSLKTGTKIIGWLNLIGNILMDILFGLGLAAIYYVEEHPHNLTPEQQDMLDHAPALKAMAIVFIIIHIIGCVMSMILLLGVYQNKAKMVLIWVLVSSAVILIEQLTNVVQLFTLYQAINVFTIAFFLLDVYFILVAYSFYREIQNVNNYA